MYILKNRPFASQVQTPVHSSPIVLQKTQIYEVSQIEHSNFAFLTVSVLYFCCPPSSDRSVPFRSTPQQKFCGMPPKKKRTVVPDKGPMNYNIVGVNHGVCLALMYTEGWKHETFVDVTFYCQPSQSSEPRKQLRANRSKLILNFQSIFSLNMPIFQVSWLQRAPSLPQCCPRVNSRLTSVSQWKCPTKTCSLCWITSIPGTSSAI